MLQVYPVYHQLSPWSKLYIPGPSGMCSRCTRSIINYHPGTCIHVPGPSVTCSRCTRSIINYHPGTSYTSQGPLSHDPGVPGLSSIITLVHVYMSQGLLSHAPGVPGLYQLSPWYMLHVPGPSVTCTRCTRPISTITLVHICTSCHMYQVYHQLSPWSKLHIPGPSVTCTRCTRPIINYHPCLYCCPYQRQPRCKFHNMHMGPSYISVYSISFNWFDLHQVHNECNCGLTQSNADRHFSTSQLKQPQDCQILNLSFFSPVYSIPHTLKFLLFIYISGFRVKFTQRHILGDKLSIPGTFGR
jgi:hypothetical protein